MALADLAARQLVGCQTPLWRILDGIPETDYWVEAIDMPGAQVAVADYRPAWWPTNTRLVIRRVRLNWDQISANSLTQRRRTLHPDQRALPLEELTDTEAVYGYSFILTNLDASTPERAADVEHRYRHRTEIENIFREPNTEPPYGTCSRDMSGSTAPGCGVR